MGALYVYVSWVTWQTFIMRTLCCHHIKIISIVSVPVTITKTRRMKSAHSVNVVDYVCFSRCDVDTVQSNTKGIDKTMRLQLT